MPGAGAAAAAEGARSLAQKAAVVPLTGNWVRPARRVAVFRFPSSRRLYSNPVLNITRSAAGSRHWRLARIAHRCCRRRFWYGPRPPTHAMRSLPCSSMVGSRALSPPAPIFLATLHQFSWHSARSGWSTITTGTPRSGKSAGSGLVLVDCLMSTPCTRCWEKQIAVIRPPSRAASPLLCSHHQCLARSPRLALRAPGDVGENGLLASEGNTYEMTHTFCPGVRCVRRSPSSFFGRIQAGLCAASTWPG